VRVQTPVPPIGEPLNSLVYIGRLYPGPKPHANLGIVRNVSAYSHPIPSHVPDDGSGVTRRYV